MRNHCNCEWSVQGYVMKLCADHEHFESKRCAGFEREIDRLRQVEDAHKNVLKAALYNEPPMQPVILYPSQLWMAESMGWTRGKEYVVYKCLKCLEDMDRCKCKTR